MKNEKPEQKALENLLKSKKSAPFPTGNVKSASSAGKGSANKPRSTRATNRGR